MTTRHIVAADVRQYWNKYVRFHRGRLGIWVLAGYAALVFGFLNESPDAIVTLPAISRFSLMILLTVITVLSEGWSRSYQYFFVRQETRLLSRFRVSTVSMVLSFTVITIVETMPSTLTYTVTFSFSHHSVILLFGLLFLVRLGTTIGVSWLGTFVVTNLKLVPGVFVVIELFLKLIFDSLAVEK
ncbi:hypothetical protein [Alicyclobacillus sp. SO9]|uniref:hypothetical protein n=1 Tax=Alicyclobacillus sp. SO9 TaxID=2665646 RepID=UPI0018E78575|nr:hypothetical protein [Alicyclobacillus sp. SO9]QQE78421.1 hypothetical protein GI364_21515 [Alicyclobacillus sp. SO9]